MVKYNLTKVDWNNEYNWEMDVLNDLISHYNKHKNLHILLNSDGMDVKKSGLKNVIKILKELFPLVTIETVNANLLGNDTFKHNHGFVKCCQLDLVAKKSITHTFCGFYGRPSYDRLALASWIYNNAKQKSLLSYNGSLTPIPNFEGDGHVLPGVDFDVLCKKHIEKVDLNGVLNFLKVVPYKVSKHPSGQYTAKNPLLLTLEYQNSFVEIVAETAKAGEVFFPTEKTYRPILFRTPFIIFGPVNFLSNLKKLGFRTFDKWFDETYDTIGDDNQRLVEVLNVMEYLNTLSLNEIQTMYNEMLDVVQHNYEVLMRLTKEDFNRERFK